VEPVAECVLEVLGEDLGATQLDAGNEVGHPGPRKNPAHHEREFMLGLAPQGTACSARPGRVVLLPFENVGTSSHRAPSRLLQGIVAAVVLVLVGSAAGAAVVLVAGGLSGRAEEETPRPRASDRGPSETVGEGCDKAAARAGDEEARERCKELRNQDGTRRPDFPEPIPIRSLPAQFTAPCPAPFNARTVPGRVSPGSLPAYGRPLLPVTGEWVEFESSDGLTIPAYLARPDDGKAYPGVVWAHGGFFNDVDPSVVETIASAGYVALGVAYRGSSGHGSELEFTIDVAGKEVDDLAAGARFLQARPDVIGDRLAVAGGSHGGALALTSIYRFPGLFSAAADFYGVTDWGCIFLRQPLSLVQYSFGGNPVRAPAEYLERSAYYNADRIDVPVYIAHGMLDRGIPPGESLKMAEALQEAGGTVTTRFVIGKGHGFIQQSPPRSPLWADFFRFLDEHLK
jgi:dienelactone hydrolase